MAKKFQFRLEALLKLREFKEQEIKIELGNILKEIAYVEEEIKTLNIHIDESYKSQENIPAGQASGKFMSFFPAYVEAKKADILAKENILFSLRKRYKEKLKEMHVARGETKVIDKLKEKEKTAFKKETEKKMQQDIEDNLIITKSSQLNGEGESA
ncbi:MAG: hypothetical protein OHK0056_15290 [Bacteriovoracaceae bacterium]